MNAIDEAFALYDDRGSAAYFGAAVSMREHALQAAHFAEALGAPDALIAAALLHDIGHLLAAVPEDIHDWSVDARHELTGARWLRARFGAAVAEPVRLHVPAKRYLCATDPTYFAQLSEASVLTLTLQGGPLSPVEVAAFEREAAWGDALIVRRSDDRGKIAGFSTPPLEHYRPLLKSLRAA